MRVVKLTPVVERKLLGARQKQDGEAKRIASKIIHDIHRRGDAALFAWVKKLDDIDLQRESLWISEREMEASKCRLLRLICGCAAAQ